MLWTIAVILLILWLLWYGVRKRRYASTSGTVQGWLSAHVYLGTALVVIVGDHYMLMIIVLCLRDHEIGLEQN